MYMVCGGGTRQGLNVAIAVRLVSATALACDVVVMVAMMLLFWVLFFFLRPKGS